MFYFIIAVAILGYLIYQGLQRIERKSLTISCPCVLVLSIIVSFILYQSDHIFIAAGVLMFGFYIFGLHLAAIRKVSIRALSTNTGSISQQ